VQKDPSCEEANFNLIMLLWRRGKLLDDKVCDEIFARIEDKTVAQLLVLLFRKGNMYPVEAQTEQAILR